MIPPRLNVILCALHHDSAENVHTPRLVSLRQISIMSPSSRLSISSVHFFDKNIIWILTLVIICLNCSYNKAQWNDCLLLTRTAASCPSTHAFTHKMSTFILFSSSRKLFIFISRLLRKGPINISSKRLWIVSLGGKAKYSFAEHSYQRTQRQQHPLLRCCSMKC